MTMWGYTRVSTEDQKHDLQKDDLIALGVSPENIYSDTVSGAVSTAARPNFEELRQKMMSGDTLIVWKLDRLGRSAMDVLRTATELYEKGIALKTIKDGIDSTTSIGRAIIGILASLANLERDTIAERVRAGIAAAKKRGVTFGRKRQATAEMGQIVHTLLEQGMLVNAIARQLKVHRCTVWRAHQLYLANVDANTEVEHDMDMASMRI